MKKKKNEDIAYVIRYKKDIPYVKKIKGLQLLDEKFFFLKEESARKQARRILLKMKKETDDKINRIDEQLYILSNMVLKRLNIARG